MRLSPQEILAATRTAQALIRFGNVKRGRKAPVAFSESMRAYLRGLTASSSCRT